MKDSVKKNNSSGRNYRRVIIIAMIGFIAFGSPIFLGKGAGDLFQKLIHGDLIYMANIVMSIFVLGGWFAVYKFIGKHV